MKRATFKMRLFTLAMIVSLLTGWMPARGFAAQPHAASARVSQDLPAQDRQAFNPEPLSQSLSISRAQTSYTAGTVQVVFTLTNNLPVTRLPQISDGASSEEIAAVLAAFDPSQDANTLKNITLSDTLVSGATLLSASGSFQQSGRALTWQIDDLPPLGSAVVSMTLNTPAAGSNFKDLDDGAEAAADRWGAAVNALARPATIIPSSLGADLMSATSDAGVYDPELAWFSAGFNQDPLQAFSAVQSFRTDLYSGALRGTRGTLWGQSGNSLDKASALVAMLRLAGVPARYRHGALSVGQAQTLIASLFPPAYGVAGYLPAGIELADPVNDAALIDLASDHWWVEAYLPGAGWTDLDPTFPQADVGQSFAVPASDGTDRSAAVPDGEHHTLRVRLKVEQYNAFPVGGVNLSSFYALDQTFDVSDLASKRVTLGHLVSESLAGGVFSSLTRTYTPYLGIEDNNQGFQGDTFQDYLTNFPLSSKFTTAEWLEYELHSPDGQVESFSREVKDLIGPATRRLGGGLSLALNTSSEPFFQPEDQYVNWILPNTVSGWALRRQSAGVLDKITTLGTTSQHLLEIAARLDPSDVLTGDDLQAYLDGRSQAASVSEYLLTRIGLDFAWQADNYQAQIEAGLHTRLYYDSPRVFTIASVGDPTEAVTTTVDLRHTTAQTLVYPGQAASAGRVAQWVKGLSESSLEGQALEDATGQPAVTSARVFDEMALQGIAPVLIKPGDYGLLDSYDFTPDTLAHVLEALEAGKLVLIPSRAVMVDGSPVFSWWEVDPETGETVSVGENGLHSALEYRLLQILVEGFIETYSAGSNPLSPPSTVQLAESALAIGLKLRSYFFAVADGFNQSEAAGARLPGLSQAALSGEWRNLPAFLCPHEACGVEQFFTSGLTSGLMPLPNLEFVYGSAPGEATAITSLSASQNGSGGAPAFTLSTDSPGVDISPGGAASVLAQVSTNFSDDFILGVYAPSGWSVLSGVNGQFTLEPPAGVLPGPYAIDLVAQSTLHPDLVSPAVFTVTLLDQPGVQLSIDGEPNITVAMGSARFASSPNETNDGETEAPGAAYRISLTNTSGTARTFDLTVNGPPASWVILNGANATTVSLDLPSGGHADIGLYLLPPAGTLPAPGTSSPVNVSVSATGSPSLNAQANASFNMLSQAFNYMTIVPAQIYLAPQTSATLSLEVENVGNGAGSFALSSYALPPTATLSGLPAAQNLAKGKALSIPLTLDVADIPAGASFPLVVAGSAPGSTTQYALAQVRLVGPYSGPIFQTADHVAAACRLGEPVLSAALKTLAVAIANLEATCDSGSCDLGQRDQAVEAAQEVARISGDLSNLVNADLALSQAATSMASHTNQADLQADMQAMSEAISPDLENQVCELSEHQPSLRWIPGYSAALPGQLVDYTLELTNLGSLQTTYAVSVTLPSGLQTFNATLDPGETSSHTYPVSSASVGVVDVSAQAVATGPDITLPSLGASAATRLNVVERFVQLTAVHPEPGFVETGSSSTKIYVDVNDLANLPIDAAAQLNLIEPGGEDVYTAEIPLTLYGGGVQTYDLGSVDTSGWAAGVYTVTVDLLCAGDLCAAPDALPDGSGYGYLTVGQGLQISHAVAPETVAGGSFTVTTLITSQLTTPSILPPASLSRPAALSSPLLSAAPADEASEAIPAEVISSTVFPSLPHSASPITRTEDTNPAITYSGVWTVVNNINGLRASHGDYTWADAAGETAAFDFTGTWVHIGFATYWKAGQAEIFIDGASQGIVDTYTRDNDEKSFVYDGLANSAHTLQVVVLGTHHPNSTGNQISLDFIDAWDGTLFPDGLVEQDNPRVWRGADWAEVVNVAASGGSYMTDGGANSGYAWFPFTGDSVTFVGFANGSGFRTGVTIDGVWKENLWMYDSTGITRTISFDGLGSGPHVMMVHDYFGEPNVDAFITPATEPVYTPPVYSGIVRYEEDNPAVLYNGYPYRQRPQSFFRETATAPGTSDMGDVVSSALNDHFSLTFYGRWINLGFLSDNRSGQAEVFIDGESQGIVGLYQASASSTEIQYGDLITGTHTVSITVLHQPDPPGTAFEVALDYIDVWDGTPMPDDFANAHKGTVSDRLHYNKSGVDATHPNAIQGDYLSSGLSNSYAAAWYSFVGDSFVLYGLTRNNVSTVEVYVDGLLVDTPSFSYPYSEQPYAYFYSGFDYGPHDVHIRNVSSMRLDGFASNPSSPASYRPLVEWYESDRTAGASIWGGLHVPAAVGDVDGDGSPEIVVASSNIDSNGELFLMRGDGSDAGDGTPIIWSHPYNIFNGFEDVGAPAIAELDGQPGAEIIHPTASGLFVYHDDGSIYWYTDTLHSFAFFSAPAVGNLDLDPDPEIVVNLSNNLVVFKQDGTLAWQHTFPSLGMPVLADLNGDGFLDILVHESGTTNLYMYDYNLGSPVLGWTKAISSALSIYGTPAVADIDGSLPGGDPGPEIAIASDGYMNVLNGEDGSLVWSTPITSGNASGVAIGDIDGDGEVELVTGVDNNSGILYAFNADGSILWSVPALDNSPLNVSLMDLNGDGIDEIAFNGADQGLTIYNGPDGALLFNEPSLGVISQTGSDYPLFADVDGDGYGELVVSSQGGIRVFGWDGVWGPARPVWNQLTYHITNVNDNLTIPFHETDSWTIHNTYRDQTALVNPLPAYSVALTHTVGLDGVTVLTDTFSTPPDQAVDPDYAWSYQQDGAQPEIVTSFQSRLDDLQPGESRLVAQKTRAVYTLPGGANDLLLPPLYVNVRPLVTISPSVQQVSSGGTGIYGLTLFNPLPVETTFSLDLSGLPESWTNLPASLVAPASGEARITFSIDVPLEEGAGQWGFSVQASSLSGPSGQAGAEIQVSAPVLQAAITPTLQSASPGQWTAYSLLLTNLDSVDHTVTLTATGLAEVDLPTQAIVPAGQSQSVAFNARTGGDGPHPFTVEAVSQLTGERAQAGAILNGEGQSVIALVLDPPQVSTGLGSPAVFSLTLTNLGSSPAALDLDVGAPSGWESDLKLFGQPANKVYLAPGGLDSTTLQLILIPPDSAAPATYSFTVTATDLVGAEHTTAGKVQILAQGVQVELLSGPAELDPGGSGTWQVQVTNTGSQSRTFDVSAFGALGAQADLSKNAVTLSPGQAETIQLQASASPTAQAGSLLLGVLAQSRTNNAVKGEDSLQVPIAALLQAAVQWKPGSLILHPGVPAPVELVIENTGNVETTFQAALTSLAGVVAALPYKQAPLPPGGLISLPVTISSDQVGSYTLSAEITGGTSKVQADLDLRVEIDLNPIYIPLMFKVAGK